jgi:hypothetical protein
MLRKILLAGAWLAILAAAPYVYSNRHTLDAWGVLLYFGLVLIVGVATIFFFTTLLDDD